MANEEKPRTGPSGFPDEDALAQILKAEDERRRPTPGAVANQPAAQPPAKRYLNPEEVAARARARQGPHTGNLPAQYPFPGQQPAQYGYTPVASGGSPTGANTVETHNHFYGSGPDQYGGRPREGGSTAMRDREVSRSRSGIKGLIAGLCVVGAVTGGIAYYFKTGQHRTLSGSTQTSSADQLANVSGTTSATSATTTTGPKTSEKATTPSAKVSTEAARKAAVLKNFAAKGLVINCVDVATLNLGLNTPVSFNLTVPDVPRIAHNLYPIASQVNSEAANGTATIQACVDATNATAIQRDEQSNSIASDILDYDLAKVRMQLKVGDKVFTIPHPDDSAVSTAVSYSLTHPVEPPKPQKQIAPQLPLNSTEATLVQTDMVNLRNKYRPALRAQMISWIAARLNTDTAPDMYHTNLTKYTVAAINRAVAKAGAKLSPALTAGDLAEPRTSHQITIGVAKIKVPVIPITANKKTTYVSAYTFNSASTAGAKNMPMNPVS